MNGKGQIHTKIKLVIVILSILLISYGWIVKNTTIAVIGAFVYLMDITHHSLPLISEHSLPVISVQSLPVRCYLD